MQEEPIHDEALNEPRLILVDTNCFLRLYQSPVRPFLGKAVGVHRLVTIDAMVQEFMRSERLQDKYAWLLKDIRADVVLDGAILRVTQEHADAIKENFKTHEMYANALLSDYCAKEGTVVMRSLSRSDLELLATAITLEGLVATDEWPLTLVIDDLAHAPEEGYNLGCINSIHVLQLFEQNAAITRTERIATIKAWLQYSEILPRNWREIYSSLFKEPPPTL